MTSLVHLYVETVDQEPPGRTCLVCKAQSRVGLVAIVNPVVGVRADEDESLAAMVAALALVAPDSRLFAPSIVYQGAGEPPIGGGLMPIGAANIAAFRIATEPLDASIFRGALTSRRLPDSLPCDPEARDTVIQYQYREIIDVRQDLTLGPDRGVRAPLAIADDLQTMMRTAVASRS